MRRILIGILFFFLSSMAIAQSDPNYSFYMFNSLPFNPAFAGNRDNLSIQSSYRAQWVGLEGAPRTMFFNADMPIHNNKMAIGFDVYNDQIGDFNTTKSYLSYAYRFQLNDKFRASLGLAAGYEFAFVDRGNLLKNANADPIVNQLASFYQTFDVRSGLYISSNDLYFGLSATNILEDLSNNLFNINKNRTMHITAGYLKNISPSISLYPSIIYRDDFKTSAFFNFSQFVAYESKYWLGISYRNGLRIFNEIPNNENSNSRVLSGLFRMEIKENITFGYSYDYSLSGLNNFENGSHEFIISYLLNTKKSNRILNPRYL